MSQVQHDGIIESDKLYTIHALARIFGVKEEETVERWIAELECKVIQLGKRRVVTGHEFILACERHPGIFLDMK